ncbi:MULTISPECIES: hypothetical protein [unclassified Streptomyces]|uniref:hypothetical protein n=1 Tax=unclassified Streptomyces TaxID=2593676 RepID=UPI00324715CF
MTTGRAAAWRSYSPAAFWRKRLSRYRTRRLLEVHLLVLLMCGVVAVTALLVSYRQTQRDADALASREAPAVQGLAAARLAALRADWEVQVLVELNLVDVAGSGETYRAQLSAADQGLSRIADRTDQDLGTVNGLLATYGNSLSLGTSKYRDQALMREQKLDEASSLLTRTGVGLAPRLNALQQVQMRHAEATAGLGWVQRTGWWLAELALAAFALTLFSALFVLRDRCGRDWNPFLIAAFVITVVLSIVPLLTASSTRDDLDSAVGHLRYITDVSQQSCCDHPPGRAAVLAAAEKLASAQGTVTERSEEVRRKLADDAWTDRVYQGSLIGGLLIVVLPAMGLVLRLDSDYWRRR